MITYLLFIIIIPTLIVINFFNDFNSLANECSSLNNCAECIKNERGCIWCDKPGDFTSNSTSFSRCKDKNSEIADWAEACEEEYIIDPENKLFILQAIPFSENDENIIQMTPQLVRLGLRAGQAENIMASFKRARGYPVDVFILIGLPQVNNGIKDHIFELRYNLFKDMKELTTNFRLGYGVFVDNSTSERLVDSGDECSPPFGIKRISDLSKNFNAFTRDLDIGSESPLKGGFESVVEAIKCGEQVGWRRDAMRFLVIVTDANIHNLIAEVGEPLQHYDSDVSPYPNIDQLNQVAREEDVNMIFAFTSYQSETPDLSNLAQFVTREYNKITIELNLVDNSRPPISIRYFNKCNENVDKEIDSSVCQNINVGDEVEIRIEVSLDMCSSIESNWKQQVLISPIGLSDVLTIDLEMLCNCGNEDHTSRIVHANVIPKPREKIDTFVESDYYDETSCKASQSAHVCSGQGKCVSGYCECDYRDNANEMISGQFCECTNFQCEYHDGQLCSGPDRGSCTCNTCNCKQGWTGSACHCQDSVNNCTNPETGNICSNNGDCECNQCKCCEGYSGQFCQHCPTCRSKCTEYKSCVECQAFGTGDKGPEECARQCTFNAKIVDRVKVRNARLETLCSFYDDEDCRYSFVVRIQRRGKLFVRVQKERDCPPLRA